jgi:hypothetical protein
VPDLRLADLLAALSVTTDLAMGQSRELAIRSCVVATAIARRIGLPEAEVSVVYYTTLLKHLGCTATSHEETQLFGPDELGCAGLRSGSTSPAGRRRSGSCAWRGRARAPGVSDTS